MKWLANLLGYEDRGIVGSFNRRVAAKREEADAKKDFGKSMKATAEVVTEVASSDEGKALLTIFGNLFGKGAAKKSS